MTQQSDVLTPSTNNYRELAVRSYRRQQQLAVEQFPWEQKQSIAVRTAIPTAVLPSQRTTIPQSSYEQLWTVPAGKVTSHEIPATGNQLVTGYLVSQTAHNFDFQIRDSYGNVILFNRGVTNQRFVFRPATSGSYWLVVDNHLSMFRGKQVRVSYSIWGDR